MTYDYAIIGGGIVGLATARAIRRRQPDAQLLLIEKEPTVAAHQTGHNSGVIHAGVYYAPGSLKATLCHAGAMATKAFCRANGIPFDECGKLLVATSPREMARMEVLEGRARQNGLVIERLTAEALREREPNVTGLGALFVPASGIVSYRRISEVLAAEALAAGLDMRLGTTVTGIREAADVVTLDTDAGDFSARRLIACAGLQADRIARLAGLSLDHRIVPFRGEYYVLPASKWDVVNHLIYPIPDPDLPFLGIHLTRMIDGSVTVGPNAVLGFAREGYARGTVSLKDVADMAGYPGFWRTLATHWRSGLKEFRNSLSRAGYLEECRKYCPSLELGDLRPYPAGIRAQAVARDGTLVHDFLFAESARTLHVVNAPSPAATSAFPIGEMIVDRVVGNAPSAAPSHSPLS